MMLALQGRGCRNINLVTPVELSQDRQQDIDAVLEPARRHLLNVSQSFSADEVRVLFDYFTRAAPALMAAVTSCRPARRPLDQPTPADRWAQSQ